MKKAVLFLTLLLFGPANANDRSVLVAMVEGSADAISSRAVVKEAYSQLGIPVEFRAYSAAGALAASNGGEATAELARIDGVDQTYENLIQIPIPINLIQGVAFSKKYRFPVSGWHSLRPFKIGIVKGIVFAERNTNRMEREVFDDYPQLMQAIQEGRIDVGVMPRIEGLQTLRSMSIRDIYEMEGILETLFLYHYVHVSRAELVEQLSPILKTMLLSGETRKKSEAAIKVFSEFQ